MLDFGEKLGKQVIRQAIIPSQSPKFGLPNFADRERLLGTSPKPRTIDILRSKISIVTARLADCYAKLRFAFRRESVRD
jgi:hypothetical protein